MEDPIEQYYSAQRCGRMSEYKSIPCNYTSSALAEYIMEDIWCWYWMGVSFCETLTWHEHTCVEFKLLLDFSLLNGTKNTTGLFIARAFYSAIF